MATAFGGFGDPFADFGGFGGIGGIGGGFPDVGGAGAGGLGGFGFGPGFGGMGFGGFTPTASSYYRYRRRAAAATRGPGWTPTFGTTPALGWGGARVGGPQLIGAPGLGDEGDWFPDMDVIDTPKDVVIYVEVPGIPKENVKMDVRNDLLVISGQRPTNPELDSSDNIRLSEREFGRFRRVVRLPADVDVSNITAKIENGLLEVRVPKGQGGAEAKITIQ
ncbi:hypothetical protein HK102_013792 [Quaeritorhiza haematococci]|nr:hypothetical protein HK102_013792 [Quaeritorhiza haematococci]